MIKDLKSLLKYIIPYKRKAFLALFLAFPLAAVKFYQARLVKPIFDKGLSSQSDFNEILLLALILLGLALLNVPCRFFHFYLLRFVSDKAACDLRRKVYSKLQSIPLNYFQNNKMGEMISKIIVDTQTTTIGFQGGVDFIREIIIGLSMLGLALYRDVPLTLVIIGVSPLFIIIFNRAGKKVRTHQAMVQENMANMTHNVSEGLQGQKLAKAFNLQNYILNRFEKAQEKYFRFQMKSTKVEEITSPLVEFVGGIAFSGVIVFAHSRISSGAMTTGDFVSFVTALALLMDPIRKFSRSNLKINQARAAGERLEKIFELKEEKNSGNREDINFNKEIIFENVYFSYGKENILEDFNLKIEKGKKVALVGLSGAGKSTIINILLGLYPIKSGKILIDGISIYDYSLKSLRSLFGLVSQDVFLFNDTIKENLLLGNESLENGIDEALKIAGANEFINKLDEGIETIIGDRGTRLSGGQGQRVTIARAYLQNTPILLFDEATSALDNESEKIVQQSLERLAKEKTVVAVAHRLSTISDYDQIVVLNNGRIVETGKHQELMNMSGEYQKLYQLGLDS